MTKLLNDEQVRDQMISMYFNMLVKERTLASVANLTDATLKQGEGFIDQVIELIQSQKKAYADWVIGKDEDDRYEDVNGEMHDGMLPIVQDLDDAIDAETRNDLRAAQRQRNESGE